MTALLLNEDFFMFYTETLYRRITGKHGEDVYSPVAESSPIGRFQHGTHVITSRPGVVSRLYRVPPSSATMLSALLPLREELIVQLLHAGEVKPPTLTHAQRKAWNTFVAQMGGELSTLQMRPVADIVDQAFLSVCEALNPVPETGWPAPLSTEVEV